MRKRGPRTRERIYTLTVRLTREELFTLRALRKRSGKTITSLIVDSIPYMRSFIQQDAGQQPQEVKDNV